MKVLVANWFSSRGGEEKHVFDTLSKFAARGCLDLYVAAPGSSPWDTELASLKGVKRLTVNFSSKGDVATVLKLFWHLRRHRFDVVHVHGARAGWLVRLAAWLSGYRNVVWTMHLLIQDHVSRQPGWSKGIYSALERFLNRRTARIIAVSENLRLNLLASDPGLNSVTVVTVPNGIDPPGERVYSPLRRSLNIPDSAKVGLAVGKLQREKGHDILIRAIALIPEPERPHAAVAGTGMLQTELEALIESLGVAAHVHLMGFQDNVLGILEAVDFYAMPSRYEGFPIALLEAMALGKPIVAAAVNGIPEAIQDGSNGLLVPAEDDTALAAAILKLTRDPGLATQLGARARKTFEDRFTLDRCCDRIMDVYASVSA